MSALNNSFTSANQISTWTTILLSSSVVLATITGVFYLVGAGYVEGSAEFLGLTYLAQLQSADYIRTGAEFLLATSPLLYILFAYITIFAIEIAVWSKVKLTHLPRRWENRVFAVGTWLGTVFLFAVSSVTTNSKSALINHVCPVTGHPPIPLAVFVSIAALVLVTHGSLLFVPLRLRINYLVWAIIVWLVSIYNLGWVFGANRIYNPFPIVEVDNTSLHLPSEARLLLLGADDKNLVAVIPDKNRRQHPQPIYLPRSQIQTFRIVGSASINDFFCKSPVR
jgi:hypothetical protein